MAWIVASSADPEVAYLIGVSIYDRDHIGSPNNDGQHDQEPSPDRWGSGTWGRRVHGDLYPNKHSTGWRGNRSGSVGRGPWKRMM